MAFDLEKEANRVGLKINTNKIRTFNLSGHRTFPICINQQNIEQVEQFQYLEIDFSPDCGTESDVARPISSARSFFATFNTNINLWLFHANFFSVLLYESST